MTLRVHAAMPSELVPRPAGSALAVIGTLVLAVYVTLRMLFDARMPRDPIWSYPSAEVAHFLEVITAEVLGVWIVMRWRGGSAAERAGLVGLASIAMWPLLCVFSMHADSTRWWLVDWHVVLSAWLVVFAVGRGVVALVEP